MEDRHAVTGTRFVCVGFLVAAMIGGVFHLGGAAAADMQSPMGVFDVRNYGAVGDGVTLDTKAIQTAVDHCAHARGGRVCLHGGTFLSGTIYLKSNVTLYIEAGAVLLGSTNLQDYPATVPAYRSYTDNYVEQSLIYAEKAENVSIMGRGVIDGQGASFKGLPWKQRPYIIRFVECNNVMTKDVTIRNSPMWVQHYLACEDVTIDGISVHSKVNANNDGINIDSCDKVRISNCEINSGDDAIVLKSTSDRVCSNVTVTNCVLSTYCNALKLGTESNGGFENIAISNCTIYDTNLAGIALELVDGGTFDRVAVSNVSMKNVGCAVFIRLGNRARPFKKDMQKPGMGSMRNIIISNVQATGVNSTGCSITGLPGFPVENVTIENVRIRSKGGGAQKLATRRVPEQPDKYPEYKMFGALPAYGFYVRHAKNVTFHQMELEFEKDDHRPALVFDDVSDVDILGLDAETTPSAHAMIWFKQVDGALLHGCRPRTKATTFLRVDGEQSRNISLMDNDLSNVTQVVERGKGVRRSVVYLGNNRVK